jgi:hypothetical protein
MKGGPGSILSGFDVTVWRKQGELLEGMHYHHYALDWELADPDSFLPQRPVSHAHWRNACPGQSIGTK